MRTSRHWSIYVTKTALIALFNMYTVHYYSDTKNCSSKNRMVQHSIFKLLNVRLNFPLIIVDRIETPGCSLLTWILYDEPNGIGIADVITALVYKFLAHRRGPRTYILSFFSCCRASCSVKGTGHVYSID